MFYLWHKTILILKFVFGKQTNKLTCKVRSWRTLVWSGSKVLEEGPHRPINKIESPLPPHSTPLPHSIPPPRFLRIGFLLPDYKILNLTEAFWDFLFNQVTWRFKFHELSSIWLWVFEFRLMISIWDYGFNLDKKKHFKLLLKARCCLIVVQVFLRSM